jgi:hypothetical protein
MTSNCNFANAFFSTYMLEGTFSPSMICIEAVLLVHFGGVDGWALRHELDT